MKKTDNQNTINQLLKSLNGWQGNGNKVSDSSMFYYCPWYTGKKDN